MSGAALRIHGRVQHYEWGGYDFIPALLGLENRERRPFAELWLGAHRSAPALAEVGRERVPLDRLAPGLPYLLKVLDARSMLSIQAHPDKAQAEAGFARENAAGVPLDAPQRNYRDDNHKPEVHVALTDLWMLHGFRRLEDVGDLREAAPAARSVKELYTELMTMPQTRVDAWLGRLSERLERERPASKDDPDYWALRAAREYPGDRGVLSFYLLNLVHLRPGQGTYQAPGVLHAYLEGANVELMANSDNVLRGGLTPKHVDVEELLRTLSFASGTPAVLEGEKVSESETVYRTPAKQFELGRIAPGQFEGEGGPDTLMVVEGRAELRCAGAKLELRRGDSVFVPAAAGYELTGEAVVYRAGRPRGSATPGASTPL